MPGKSFNIFNPLLISPPYSLVKTGFHGPGYGPESGFEDIAQDKVHAGIRQTIFDYITLYKLIS